MNSITFECQIITPMFLAGADGRTPELRPASLKGALRYWWRAMHGHLSVDELRKREVELFGGGGDDGRRSRVSVTISPHTLTIKQVLPEKRISTPSPTEINPDRKINADLFIYLAYGAHEREYIDAGGKFNVTFRYDNQISLENDLVKPFQMVSYFGGLGAKSRNGYGCFKILSSSDTIAYVDSEPDHLLKDVKYGLLRDYTAFSDKMKLYKTKMLFPSWNKALETVGTAYVMGKRGLENAHDYSKRAYVAAPITQSGISWHKDRHAKQYFLSVTRNSANNYKGWILFLPYNHHHNTPADAYSSSTGELNAVLSKYLQEVV